MAWHPIDLERGVIQRINHNREGLMVCMYIDAPGEYYAPNGAPCAAEFAVEAGFDVESDRKERKRLERRAAALAEIDKEFEVIADGEIVEDTGLFQLQHVGGGWYNILDEDGGVVNPSRMRHDAAVDFMEVLQRNQEAEDGKKE